MKYSIDTCALLDGWQRYYPKDVFPGLWKNLAGLIRNGGLHASEEVKFELAKKMMPSMPGGINLMIYMCHWMIRFSASFRRF